MKSNTNITEAYIVENEFVLGLDRLVIDTNNSKSGLLRKLYSCFPPSVRRISDHIKSFVGYVLIDLITNWNEIFKLWNLKGKKGLSALVVGNGPSQGYLTVECLNRFKANDGETFVVNFWHLNKQLSTFVPNYLVISDPATLDLNINDKEILRKNFGLLEYLKANVDIKILCPISRCKQLADLFGASRVFGFVDRELRGITTNVAPIFPRGYVSMTLYKALALCIWFGYRDIYVIGMDNTYPRNIYCDKNNAKLNLEMHAGGEYYVSDMTSMYPTMGYLMDSLSRLFHDAWKFHKYSNIKNLDQYSLTDAFKKIPFADFFEEMKNPKHEV